MGAHSRSGATASTGARFATTTLAIAATSVLGAGTALAHDDSGNHEAPHSSTSWDDAGSDPMHDVGMSDWDSTWDSSWDSSWEDEGSDDAEDTGDGATQVQQAAAPAPAPAPARPATSTQPIAAPASTVPAELPAPGETQTIPIRGTR